MSSLSDLLPLLPETRKPNAYDVFGLASGEQDTDKITAAAIKTVEHLKVVKDQTDPALWQQAAQLVDQARQILADPNRKAGLDAKLRSETAATPVAVSGSAVASASKSTGAGQRGDPLAGLLPAGDPLKPLSVGEPDVDRGSIDMPPGLFGTPAESSRGPVEPKAVSDPTVVKPQTRPSRRRTGRKKSKSISWMLGLMVMGLFAVTGLLGYFVFFGPGTIEVVKTGDKITISTEPQSESTTQTNPVAPRSQLSIAESSGRRKPDGDQPAKHRDPVMGNLLDGRLDDSQPPSPTDNLAVQSEPPMITSPATDPIPNTDSTPNIDLTTKKEPEPAVPAVPMMEASQQDVALAKVRQLIRDADWDKMKAEAESLKSAPLSDENQVRAEALYELADLATYYREGIERAVKELQVGNDFAVTDALRVIVVETGDDLLTVRYNKKNRSFRFNEFPFSLAHRLATFQVPNSPTGQAAKAVFQAVAPKSTDAHRAEAIDWLKSIDGEVEGADPIRLAETIESIYQPVEP